jgi:DNA-binding phage protein
VEKKVSVKFIRKAPAPVEDPIPTVCRRPPDSALRAVVEEAWQKAMHTSLREVLRQYVRFALRRRDRHAYQDYFFSALQHAVSAEAGLREEHARKIVMMLGIAESQKKMVRDRLQKVLTELSEPELETMMERVMNDVYTRLCCAIQMGRKLKNVSNPHGYTYVRVIIPEQSRTECICTVDLEGKSIKGLALQTPKRFNRTVRFRLRPVNDSRPRPRTLRRVS